MKILKPARQVNFTPPYYWYFGKLFWRIFGNADDPYPCNWFWSNKPLWLRRFWWLFIRNPLHNFFWYTLGFTNNDRVIYGRDPKHVFIPTNGWNWHFGGPVNHLWLKVPFLSYQHKFNLHIFQFYIGWRYAGNFGICLRLMKR